LLELLPAALAEYERSLAASFRADMERDRLERAQAEEAERRQEALALAEQHDPADAAACPMSDSLVSLNGSDGNDRPGLPQPNPRPPSLRRKGEKARREALQRNGAARRAGAPPSFSGKGAGG